MEKHAWQGWDNCIRLQNGEIDLIATTDVGPRIMRFGFIGASNLFKELAPQAGKTGGTTWRMYGGHRLWHAPEAMPRTYSPDNDPVAHTGAGTTLVLTQPTEPSTGIQKQITLSLLPDAPGVKVIHRLTNHGAWDAELAPWGVTALMPGGCLYVPQEPQHTHEDMLLPARPLVLWGYTDMADARYTWGRRVITLRQDTAVAAPTKFGVRNAQGWAAYALGDQVFLKLSALEPTATYPDFDCNFEFFADDNMLEIETLGPLVKLRPNGGFAEHTEHWFAYREDLGQNEDYALEKLLPLVEKSRAYIERALT